MIEIQFYNIKNKDELVDTLKNMEPLKVAFHQDSDGLGAACLLASIFKVEEDDKFPYSPALFGFYQEANVALDLGPPVFEGFSGIAIDHHPSHVPNPNYKLVLGNIPTGVMIYELFKDMIPVDKQWLAVLSATGDGQPEIVPPEIWENNPDLWDTQGNVYRDQYRNIKTYPYPMFSKLSGPINSMTRMGDAMGAYNILRKAKNIRDVINNPMALRASKKMDEDVKKIYSSDNPPVVENVGHFGIVKINSSYHIAGRIATELSIAERYITFIVINQQSGEISVRGLLTKYLTDKLAAKGYLAGGHASFGGISLLPDQEIETLVSDIRKIAKTAF